MALAVSMLMMLLASMMMTMLLLLLLSVSTAMAFQVPHDRLQRTEPALFATAPSWLAPFAPKQALSKVQVASDQFFEALQDDSADRLIPLLSEAVVWDDYVAMYQPLDGLVATERYLRLLPPRRRGELVLRDSVIGDNVAVLLFACAATQQRTVVWLSFSADDDRIQKVQWIQEPSSKTGEVGLKILSLASNFLKKNADGIREVVLDDADPGKLLTPPEQYFAAWNVRDMNRAVDQFSDDVVYDDTAFPKPLVGRSELDNHLKVCSGCFPSSFSFHADAVATGVVDTNKLAVQWHVENNGKELPFTRGISIYEINKQGKISKGIDFVDGTYVKTAPVRQSIQRFQDQISREPVRIVPAVVWAAYMYIVFISDGILPGANALQLEQRTWEEVLNLSLNFFLVAPLLHLPFSPTVHPMLEGLFNLLLSWAAMFAGFLSDDRRDKPNVLPALPIVVGMQFLTSAFLLPYITTRTSEERNMLTVAELSTVSRVTENRILGPAMLFVGSYSILWALQGRMESFGDLPGRWTTFVELLSIDRVGSSFLVDLAIFGLFQGWIIDDDLQRRGVPNTELPMLRVVAKYVPFFGLGVYLLLRPELEES